MEPIFGKRIQSGRSKTLYGLYAHRFLLLNNINIKD
jgi:hypothetical protein